MSTNTAAPSLRKRLDKLFEREILAKHVERLRTFCGIPEDSGVGGQADIPQKVIEEYWIWKILRDRGGDQSEMLDIEFIQICRNAGEPNLQEHDFKPAGLVELVGLGKLKKNDPIEFRFNSRKWIAGLFRGLTGGGKKFVVVASGDTQQRVVEEKDIRLPSESRKASTKETTKIDDVEDEEDDDDV